MLTALFGKKHEVDEKLERELELAQTTLMNRVARVMEKSTTVQLKFAKLDRLQPLHG